MAVGSRWVARRGPWGKPWSAIQVIAHLTSAYAIVCFALAIQSGWLQSDRALASGMVIFIWVDFALSLVLYFYVCLADTRYRESGRPIRATEFESRHCEECPGNILHPRVKHCQTCGKCIEDFDHHCRYLNVCVGGRTYKAWFAFVTGLFLLMAAYAYTSVEALRDNPQRFPMGQWNQSAFYAIVGVQAALSSLQALFLFSLLAQHVYFAVEGITTLEYIKDQPPGFPKLPPRGWREPVRRGECFSCNDMLDAIEAEDPGEVWFCAICQGDIGKAGLEFFACDQCDNVNVCPLCHRTALDPGAPVITYKVASLRRRAEAQANKGFRASSYASRLSSFSSNREPKLGRRTLSAVVAAVEGHTGDSRKHSFCGGAGGGQDSGDSDTSSGVESGDDL